MNKTYLAALAVVLGATATPALAHDNLPPTASFSWSPATPRTGDPITFQATASDPERNPITLRWDLDGNGSYEATGATATATMSRGDHAVTLKAIDSHGASVTVKRTVTVADAPPSGDFTATEGLSGETIRFTAVGVDDPDDGAGAVSVAWDVDGDGSYGDAGEARFATPGKHTVALRLTDPQGLSTVVRHAVMVGDRAPVADFGVMVGPDVTLTSRSRDPDGGTMQLREEWDLDADGQFDDATGPVVRQAFAPGQFVVRLRVTDGDGVSSVAERTVVIADAAAAAPAAPSDPVRTVTPSAAAAPTVLAPRLMTPFPIVRMRGRLTRRGVRVQLLTVSAVPRGARVAVSCKGKGCPRSMSLRSARRELRAGTVLEVRVTAPGAIGKLVRFTIRRGRPWLRRDGCVTPAGTTTRCV
jgi:hypothetical protein